MHRFDHLCYQILIRIIINFTYILYLFRLLISMSLTPEEQEIRTIQHWFHNWSESQRQEFFKVLVADIKPDVQDLENGIQSLTFLKQTPTTFQCQIRQFSLWFSNWSLEGKKKFEIKLLEIDPDFVFSLSEKINQ